jgi:6-pyruvoyltetrahydropterin/6-carboxytetrahydropterin synthase
MISLTKIFRFESAHAILGYPGSCAQIHGHSYELQVCVQSRQPAEGYIGGLGIIIDFKDLKMLVHENVVRKLDHKLILSKAYLAASANKFSDNELVVFEAEPTAENLLIFIRNTLSSVLPTQVRLHSLKLWETRDSFAEWLAG